MLFGETDLPNVGAGWGAAIGVSATVLAGIGAWLIRFYTLYAERKGKSEELQARTQIDIEKVHASANQTLLENLVRQVQDLGKQLAEEKADCDRKMSALRNEFEKFKQEMTKK